MSCSSPTVVKGWAIASVVVSDAQVSVQVSDSVSWKRRNDGAAHAVSGKGCHRPTEIAQLYGSGAPYRARYPYMRTLPTLPMVS